MTKMSNHDKAREMTNSAIADLTEKIAASEDTTEKEFLGSRVERLQKTLASINESEGRVEGEAVEVVEE